MKLDTQNFTSQILAISELSIFQLVASFRTINYLIGACLFSTLSSKATKLNWNNLDVIYERVDAVEGSRRTRILTRFTAMVQANVKWTKI